MAIIYSQTIRQDTRIGEERKQQLVNGVSRTEMHRFISSILSLFCPILILHNTYDTNDIQFILSFH